MDNHVPVSEPFFSVIVPVYNVRDYLRQCVESVLCQSEPSFELLLVNDGSTDGSGELCDQLAGTDPRIRVLHQENRGLSGARNAGLEGSSGKYILFLDSDDFYPQKDFLQTLRAKARDRDLICFNYARYTDRLLQKMIAYPEETEIPLQDLWLELARRNAYQSSACIKAVKRELLVENSIDFEPGMLSEDIEWSAKVMRAAKSVAIAPDSLYAYRVRQGSISKTVSPRHVEMQLLIVQRLVRSLEQVTDNFAGIYGSYVSFQYSALMINARLSRPAVSKEIIRSIRDLAWLLNYDTNRLVKLIRFAYRCVGFELTSWLLLIYFKLFCK